jgi:chromosome segregation ATPase
LVSGRDILDALTGIEKDLQNIDRRLESVERAVTHANTRIGFVSNAQELDGRRIAAMRVESAASLSRIETATRALTKAADKTVEELDEAAAEVKKEARRLRETGEHLAPTQEELDRFEITGRGIRLSATWLRIGGAVKAVPLVVKVLGILAASAGAAWAVLSHLAHKL